MAAGGWKGQCDKRINQQRAEKMLVRLRHVEKLNYVRNKTEQRVFQTEWDMQRS